MLTCDHQVYAIIFLLLQDGKVLHGFSRQAALSSTTHLNHLPRIPHQQLI